MTSMTGYGSGEVSTKTLQVTVELKSVNHRYLDISCRLPQGYQPLEHELVSKLKEVLLRGRVSLSVTRQQLGDVEYDVRFNSSAYKKIIEAVQAGLSADSAEFEALKPTLYSIAIGQREVLEIVPEALELDEEADIVFKATELALKQLSQMRTKEGRALQKDLSRIVTEFNASVKTIRRFSKDSSKLLQKRLDERLGKLLADDQVDSDRLAQEVAILADKADITEELTRLDSHISQLKELIIERGNGRAIEFLLQELLREVNTIGSKSQQTEITKEVLSCKTLIDKLKEQVSNVE